MGSDAFYTWASMVLRAVIVQASLHEAASAGRTGSAKLTRVSAWWTETLALQGALVRIIQ